MSTAAAAPPEGYRRLSTWQETMLAARLAMMVAKPAYGLPEGVKLGAWRSIGPFAAPKGESAFDHVFPVEKKLDLKRRYGKLKWRDRSGWRDGRVIKLNAPAEASTFLHRTITAAQSAVLKVWFGSDDSLTVWLNGEQVVAHKVPRGAGPNQDTAELHLRAGNNDLLMKVSNIGGDHGFYFSTNPEPGSVYDRALRRIWQQLGRDFKDPVSQRQMRWERADGIWDEGFPPDAAERTLLRRYAAHIPGRAPAGADLAAVRALYYRSHRLAELETAVPESDVRALRRAVNDLIENFGDRYPHGRVYLQQLDDITRRRQAALGAAAEASKWDEASLQHAAAAFRQLRRKALLENPVLDFARVLAVKRPLHAPSLGLPANWQGNCSLQSKGFDDEIIAFSPTDPDAEATTVYKAEGKFAGDIDLHFDADRLLFSSTDSQGRWQVFELLLNAGKGTRRGGEDLRQVTPNEGPDVDNFDACYLPDGGILFDSSAPMQGVPCVGGHDPVANLYLLSPDRKTVRQVCFDQDHDWNPVVMADGRVLYTRWEYTDTPHYFTRLLMTMHPDGTEQRAFYGSNSYWPNSLFYARPVPGHPTQVVAIVSGHHGERRMGELVLLDAARGRHEANGVVQRIPGHGQQVDPVIRDRLVGGVYPRFLHPYPLSDKYFLVACQPTARSSWGIYLVDVFDNMLLLREERGYALLEPIPWRKTPRPPALPPRVKPGRLDATVFISNIYAGDGLRGVPRGTVKRLRVLEWHYAYRGIGGHRSVTVEGGWEPKRILGTVPVESDGSALFRIPANTPLAVQPLDARGRALQLMRSWFTAMPGESVSCIGCHDRSHASPLPRTALAARQAPREIEPWYGPPRGFSFLREVQPVLEARCVSCHDGAEGHSRPDFANTKPGVGGFTASYIALQPYVRRPGPESDYHLLPAGEYHASTSELVQMLEKGHHGVTLTAEEWDRLITWIDLNVPDYGSWSERYGDKRVAEQRNRRLELRLLFAGLDEDPERDAELQPAVLRASHAPTLPPPPARHREVSPPAVEGWPFSADEAVRRQTAAGETRRSVDVDGVHIELVRIPAGSFVMGDEREGMRRVGIARSFWMASRETTNQLFARFDADHDSMYADQQWKDHNSRGYPLNQPQQPVVRVSWERAMEFCRWLSQRTGQTFTLPTEEQWEWACHAGTSTRFWWGDENADFSPFANLADQSLVRFAVRGVNPKPMANPSPIDDIIPRDKRFNDGQFVAAPVGSYRPNPWGLYDMHGNVAEWTRSDYGDGRKVVRGGSWRDRPYRATSTFRIGYASWQPVVNVGFRVVCTAAR